MEIAPQGSVNYEAKTDGRKCISELSAPTITGYQTKRSSMTQPYPTEYLIYLLICLLGGGPCIFYLR